jgi:hypothetical protein
MPVRTTLERDTRIDFNAAELSAALITEASVYLDDKIDDAGISMLTNRASAIRYHWASNR